jgi:hypothetical protein
VGTFCLIRELCFEFSDVEGMLHKFFQGLVGLGIGLLRITGFGLVCFEQGYYGVGCSCQR